MYADEATPRPRPRPSFPRRSFQPDASSTFARHSRLPFDVTRIPLRLGVLGGAAFCRRSSIGSMPSFSAILSSVTSNAKRGCTLPCPRLGPHGGLLVKYRTDEKR